MASPSGIRRCCLTLCLLFMLAGRVGASGLLDYQVSYRGVFSAGGELPIADLSLEVRSPTASSNLIEARLQASSAAYPFVESLFPIRYRFRSWTTADQGRLQGFETYESTRKLRHRLYLRDNSDAGVRRYDLNAGDGQREMAQLNAGVSPVAVAAGERLFDRLGLLQRVREQQLSERAEYRFEVTNGRERLVYRVRVEAAQILDLEGISVPAWKLRFDGLESRRNGGQAPAHRPVFLWLSQTRDQIPLRVDSRQAIGLFRIELKSRPALGQLARAGS